MDELFPQNIELGALEAFRDDLELCFDECVQIRKQQIISQQDMSKVSAFLPLLLNKVFNLSKMSLATVLKQVNSEDTQNTVVSNLEIKSEIQSKYPVLKQKIAIAAHNWRNNTSSIIQRWNNDKNDIARNIFCVDSIGNILKLGASQGDEHEGGQQTLLIKLSCGRKIAYKPRCIDIEQNFYRFAEQIGFPELYQPKYLSRSEYGWMEYIPQKDCENISQLADYYYRAGLILSLLYALEAEDIHHENVIACGSQPVLVDLETLFHHRDDSVKGKDDKLASLNLGNHTVLKTHFIPLCLKLKTEDELAAIFPVFENKTPQRGSIPRFNQQTIAVNDYIEDFIHGFQTGYRRLVAKQSALLDRNGPLKLFHGCSARYVCRPTQIYSRLIQTSSHPKYLVCGEQQVSLFSKLKLDVVGRKFLGVLVDGEAAQLARAEIPLFTHRLDQKAVLKGNQIIDRDYFSITGLELAQRKIANMNEIDLAGQVKLISLSFELVNPKPLISKPNIVIKDEMDFKQRCEVGAYSIGQFLLQQGMDHQTGKIWPLFKFNGVDRTCLEPTNGSLYDGYLGIQLFLAQLQKRFPNLCGKHEIANQSERQISQAIKNYNGHDGCGFSGLGGVLYALSQFGKLWPEKSWIKTDGQKILRLMQPLSANDDKLDIIGGSAGAILSLISYFNQSGENFALDIAADFAENLITHFQDKGQIGWKTSEGNVLSGFAHGNAGISYALMKLANYRHNKKWTECALSAMQFESEQFLPEIKNWPDRRFDTIDKQKNQAMTAWCHSAVGIGMSRLYFKSDENTTFSKFIDGDIERALSHLFSNSIVKNEGLCHGNFGNFELFILAKQRGLLDAQNEHKALSIIGNQIDFISRNGITRCDSDEFTSLSLMNGWSGIGYQLLRFSQPEKTPSILLLDS